VCWLFWSLFAGSSGAAVTVSDDRGQPITLPAAAERIVSLAPHVTELLFAVGAGAQIVGVSEYSDYPAAAKTLPRIASAGAIDYETVVGLRPDLIVAWLSGNGRAGVERLEALGLTVFATEPRNIASISRALRALGTVSGHAVQGERVAARFETQIGVLRERYAGKRDVSVFYEISARPLMTLNGAHMFTDVLRVCGGVNVFSDLRTLVSTVTTEAVLHRDAEVIMISSTIPNVEATKAAWATLPEMEAARRGQIYIVDSDLLNRQTVRLADGAAMLCALLDQARGP